MVFTPLTNCSFKAEIAETEESSSLHKVVSAAAFTQLSDRVMALKESSDKEVESEEESEINNCYTEVTGVAGAAPGTGGVLELLELYLASSRQLNALCFLLGKPRLAQAEH